MAEEFLRRHGTAVNRGNFISLPRRTKIILNFNGQTELASNELVWAHVNSNLFMPSAVVESSDPKNVTLAAFDVDRPNNRRKYQRNRVIAAFHHNINLELLV